MKYHKLLIGIVFITSFAQADHHGGLEDTIKAAMASDIRTEAEIERDRNRRPVETLEFFGLAGDMKVVELLPGGGWYTKLIAPVLAENGEYYVAVGTTYVADNVLNQPGFDKVQVTASDAKVYRKEGARTYTLEMESLDVTDADIVFTFRNYHNFGEEGRAIMNRASWDALKPGGIYAVVDHNRRHMQGDNDENGRRVDPVLAIKEIQSAGFELVDYSDLHHRPDDELRYEVGRKTVTGNTDRWTLKFRKVDR
jgi:predicted methyltransferase